MLQSYLYDDKNGGVNTQQYYKKQTLFDSRYRFSEYELLWNVVETEYLGVLQSNNNYSMISQLQYRVQTDKNYRNKSQFADNIYVLLNT